ncbi:hypothetical protein OG741_21800 [Streptomyces sp. NBC_01410]|uniref:hypothetical protein n=1 Tax=Streptomyces sp. NBC_01410 TaxID=2903856 RepID=UPI003250D9CB
MIAFGSLRQDQPNSTPCDGLCLDPQTLLNSGWLTPGRSRLCTRHVDALQHRLVPDIDDVVSGFTHLSPKMVRGELQGVDFREAIRFGVIHLVLPREVVMQHLPTAPSPASSAGLLLMLARCWRTLPSVPVRAAILAALSARNAAIDGDVDQVDAFARTWLGLRNPEAWREAVEMALLGDWVEVLRQGAASDMVLAQILRHQMAIEHRHLQPLWERRVRGKRILLLSQEVGASLSLEDLLVDRQTPETQAFRTGLGDTRIAAVLHGLHGDETVVARQWAQSRDTWAAAASAAGLPAAHGERVRRKLKRLGDRHTARRSAAAETAAARS